MLVSTVAVVLAGFIALLSDFLLRSMWFGGFRRDNDRNGHGSIFAILAVVLSILAPISAVLIQLAISRKREFLADASGALLTRYPEGLARALEKIASDRTPLRAASTATAHLWFDDPVSKTKKPPFVMRLFMTHPPVEERIRALRGMAT